LIGVPIHPWQDTIEIAVTADSMDLIKMIVRIDMPVLASRPGKAVERFTTE